MNKMNFTNLSSYVSLAKSSLQTEIFKKGSWIDVFVEVYIS